MISSGARNLEEFSQPFFDGCARGELLIPKCWRCRKHFFYPTVLCPHCHNMGFDWDRSAGRGKVYSFTEVYRPLVPELREKAPYVVAVIELEEGVRMMSNVVGCAPSEVSIGMPVEVEFGTNWEGRPVPYFHPAAS